MKQRLLSLAIALVMSHAAAADELAILSAAAVRPGLLQVPPIFASSGHRVTVGFGNATAIRNKVAAGEAVDIVVLPPPQLGELIARDLLVAKPTDLGMVRLGIAAKVGSAPRAVGSADEFRQALAQAPSFGMPDPADGSTSSTYLVKVLQQLGLTDIMHGKTTLYPDGTKALEAVARGEIALTVAPITSIFTVAGVTLLGPLPEALQLKTVYAAALTKRSAASAPANALLALLTSPEVAAAFKAKGIDPP